MKKHILGHITYINEMIASILTLKQIYKDMWFEFFCLFIIFYCNWNSEYSKVIK